jgi:hypothetical protein
MQVSILLVAAAALERKGIDESDVMKDDAQQQQPVQLHHLQPQEILSMPQIHRQQLIPDQYQHEPTPHGFMHANQMPPNNPFFGKSATFGLQLPSLHDLSERPPPPFPFGDISSGMRTEQQEAFMHGIPRNTAM